MEQEFAEGIDSWETMMFLYNSALKEVNTKLEILNDEFVHIHNYNPIEYIKSRIKTPESIVKKLKKGGYESTIENMVTYVKDIAGIRIVCSFTSDIYRLAEMIGRQNDLTVISVKDYMKHPKASGYKSYHMIVSVPIFLSNKVEDTKVEIQIRTIAMDFWASLEHKIYYKFSYFLLPLMLLLLLGLKDCLIERKHLCIKLSYDTCTLAQIAADILRSISLELVIYLVLKACPEIHSYCTNLYLNLCIFHLV